MATSIVPASVHGPLLVCDEGLSVWGGVNPATGEIVDAHHPQHGRSLAGHIVMMPTSRGSCTGSGVLLGLAFAGTAPRALIFREGEDILTLGALVAGRLFGHAIAVLRLTAAEYDALTRETEAEITLTHLKAGGHVWPLDPPGSADALELTEGDRAFLAGEYGPAAQLAMEIITTMATAQGAPRLSNRTVRFGSLAQCAESARTGLAPATPPAWIATAQT